MNDKDAEIGKAYLELKQSEIDCDKACEGLRKYLLSGDVLSSCKADDLYRYVSYLSEEGHIHGANSDGDNDTDDSGNYIMHGIAKQKIEFMKVNLNSYFSDFIAYSSELRADAISTLEGIISAHCLLEASIIKYQDAKCKFESLTGETK